jgi:hypothetical protein
VSGGVSRSQSSLRKVWLAVSLVSLAMSLGVLRITQGGHFGLVVKAVPMPDFAENTPEAIGALWGVLLGSVLVGLASQVLRQHAQASASSWALRYPFRLFDLSPERGTGKIGPLIAIVTLTVLPAFVVLKSWKDLLRHGRICFKTGPDAWTPLPPGMTSFFSWPGDLDVGAVLTTGVRLASSEQVADVCNNMTSYLGPIQSWLMVAVTAVAICLFSIALPV